MRILKRGLPVPAIAALLASCGADEPVAVEFDRPVGAVAGALAGVDGRIDMQGLVRSPVVARKQDADGSVVFLLGPDLAENRGRISFRFEPLDDGHSRVLVDAEIPEVRTMIDGRAKQLSESKIEGELGKQLRALAKRMSGGGLPVQEIEGIDQTIAFTALALDPDQVNRALALGRDDDALNSAMQRQAQWSRDDVRDWDAAGAAMDDASGIETAGIDASGSDAAGSDPSPDGDWGAPAY